MTSLNSKLQLAILNRKKGRNLLEKGFTLVELMIVIVIVGILSAVALPNFLSQTNKARGAEGKSLTADSLNEIAIIHTEYGGITTATLPLTSSCTDITNQLSQESTDSTNYNLALSAACSANALSLTVNATGINNFPSGTGTITFATGDKSYTGFK
jgi:type IV pilus assembly protein PilA